jgi:hypothetical protein
MDGRRTESGCSGWEKYLKIHKNKNKKSFSIKNIIFNQYFHQIPQFPGGGACASIPATNGPPPCGPYRFGEGPAHS